MTAEASVRRSAETGKQKQSKGRTRLRRWLFRGALVILALILLPYLIVPLYAVVNPPITPLMLQRAVFGRVGIHKQWVNLDDISPNLVRAVLAAEDARFCSHHGIDWVEVQNALQDDDGPMRGASTITMQAARNLFFPVVRSWVRKGLEAPLALYMDLVLSKRRTLEIYLNVAEWGRGVYGVGEAAERSFGVTPARLTAGQSALLAAALPSPAFRDPAKPSRTLWRVARRVDARAARLGPAADCVLK
jgi:monofunctional glycosyltransferase